MKKALGFAVAALCAVAAAACSDVGSNVSQAPEGRASSQAEAIVGGQIDTMRPDVLILQDDTLAGFRCTATLIAPNLAITARHCVGKRGVGTTLCRGDATDNGAQSLPNYVGDAPASPMFFAASPSSPLLARGSVIYDDGATTTCAHDVALIALDRSIAGITPSPLRRTPLAQGDALIAVGFGWTDRNATVNATERMRGLTHVLALGPVVYSFKPLGNQAATSELVAIAPGEVGVEGLTMTGDSGGPAFDATGQLAAIVSRGYSDALYGPGTFTSIAAHLATIDAALKATGNAPAADAGADAEKPPAPDAAPPKTTPPQAAPDAAVHGDPAAPATSGGCRMVTAPRATSQRASALAAAIGLAMLASRRRRRPRTPTP